MSFEAYWKRVLKQNPKLQDSRKLTLTVESFRQCLQRAHADGEKSGEDKADNGKSFFDRIFG